MGRTKSNNTPTNKRNTTSKTTQSTTNINTDTEESVEEETQDTTITPIKQTELTLHTQPTQEQNMINDFQNVLDSIRAAINEAVNRLTTLEDRAGHMTTRVDGIQQTTIETQQVAAEATNEQHRLSTLLDNIREQPPPSPTKPAELSTLRCQITNTNKEVAIALANAKVAYTKATELQDKIHKADLPNLRLKLATLERNQQEQHAMTPPEVSNNKRKPTLQMDERPHKMGWATTPESSSQSTPASYKQDATNRERTQETWNHELAKTHTTDNRTSNYQHNDTNREHTHNAWANQQYNTNTTGTRMFTPPNTNPFHGGFNSINLDERLRLLGFPNSIPFQQAYIRVRFQTNICDILHTTRRPEEIRARQATATLLVDTLWKVFFQTLSKRKLKNFAEVLATTFFDAGLYTYDQPNPEAQPDRGAPNECILCSKRFSDIRAQINLETQPILHNNDDHIHNRLSSQSFLTHIREGAYTYHCPYHTLLYFFLSRLHKQAFKVHGMFIP